MKKKITKKTAKKVTKKAVKIKAKELSMKDKIEAFMLENKVTGVMILTNEKKTQNYSMLKGDFSYNWFQINILMRRMIRDYEELNIKNGELWGE